MNLPNRITIENLVLDVASGELLGGKKSIRLSPKAVEVLVVLATQPAQVISREQLHDIVWHGRIVTDAQISKAINEIRVAFRDTSAPHRLIETLPRRGYRFIATATLEPVLAPPASGKKLTKPPGMHIFIGLCGLLLLLGSAYLGIFSQDSQTEPQTDSSPLEVLDPISFPLTSIGVIPFDDYSASGNHAWLASAFTTELLESLSRTPQFNLPGRRSLMLLKKQDADLATIGRKLNVGTVIEGSVQVEEEHLRIIVQLTRTSDGAQIWSARYNRELSNVFKAQSDISVLIAEAVRLELGLDTSDTSPLRYARYEPRDGRAYEIISKVSEQMRSIGDWTDPRLRALHKNTVQQALFLDPDYPAALIIKAYDILDSDPEQAYEITKGVLSREENYWPAHALLGAIAWQKYAWEEMDTHMQRALALAPWSAQLHMGYAEYLQYIFRFDEAEKHAELALRLDPLFSLIQFTRAMTDFHAGKYDSAIGFLQLTLDNGDSSPTVMSNLHRALHLAGRDAEASKIVLDLWNNIPPMRSRLDSNPALKKYLEEGNYESFISETLKLYPVNCSVNGNFAESLASIQAETGNLEAMYSCLESAQKAGFRIRLFDYRFKPYWQEPRFRAILAKYNQDKYVPIE